MVHHDGDAIKMVEREEGAGREERGGEEGGVVAGDGVRCWI